jgi:hypothetical protein
MRAAVAPAGGWVSAFSAPLMYLRATYHLVAHRASPVERHHVAPRACRLDRRAIQVVNGQVSSACK